MKPSLGPVTDGIEDIDIEHEIVQYAVREVVKMGLESPLREAILQAVDDVSDEQIEVPTAEPSGEQEKGTLTMVLQGGVVFAVMFVVLYSTLRRILGED